MNETKPPVLSKIHISSLLIAVVNIIGLWDIIDPGLQHKLVSTISIAGPLMIIVFRQFFTTKRLEW